MNIITAIEDPRLFGSLFKDQATWRTWKVCLKAIFGLHLAGQELKVYRKYTERKKAQGPFNEVFLMIGRRGGKSITAAVVSVFLAVFKDWRPQLAPGEQGYVMCVAADRKQASVVLNYIKAILRLPVFKNKILNEKKEEIELNNQITISVTTCSYRTIRGYSIVAAVCDEIAFWRDFGVNPDKEILTALRPGMANIEGSLLLAISSTYARSGILWETFNKKYGEEDPDVLVWKAGTMDMNPSFKKKEIDKALKEDYTAARAEFFAEFRADLETYLSVEAIDAIIIPGRYELGKREGVTYCAFCDPSGGRNDSMTLCVAHMADSGKIVQDSISIKKPPFNPQSCVKEFVEVLKHYGLDSVVGDRYSGSWCSSAFDKEDILYENSPLTKSDLYLEFLPIVMKGAIEILDHKEQMIELRQLERRTGRGKDTVDHPRGLHDDISNVLAGCAVMVAMDAEFADPGDIIVLDPADLHPEEKSSMKKWESEMLLKEAKLREIKEDPAITKFTTKKNARQYIALMKEHTYIKDIAPLMKVDENFLKTWVHEKLDFINETLAEVKEESEAVQTDGI